MSVIIPSQYVNYYTTKDVNGITKTVVTIDKAGIPKNTKKIKIKVVYPKISSQSQSDVEQPETGTINMVDLNVTIDENTQYPITGEFELDGTPASVNAELKVKKTYGVFNASIYEFGHDYNSYGQYGQVETLRYNNYSSPGGLAIVGSNYDK